MAQTPKAFTPYTVGSTTLKNRIVMAPMTRSRAINNLPNDLMAKYYEQRSNAGLIITEGVSPSPNGLGYSRIPGAFSKEQTEAWKKITTAVHKAGGKIFMQLMHTGRVSSHINLPDGAKVIAPSAQTMPGEMYTDKEGMKEHTLPEALSAEGLISTQNEYVTAAKNAIAAGFDGVELHSANGYLLEQFLSPNSNRRTDEYGGSVEKRARFVLEVAHKVADAIGKDKTGIRLSPYGVFNDMPHYPEIDATYAYLAEQLNQIGIAYIHLVDHSSQGAPEVPVAIKKKIRELFKNTLILSGGYDLARAEQDLSSGAADLIAFGRPFINNPDFARRIEKQLPLNLNFDASTLYTPGEKGYTDYPVHEEERVIV